MPRFQTTDHLDIHAPAQQLFATMLDYPRFHEWYPPYRVEIEGSGEVVEGARLNHVLSAKGSLVGGCWSNAQSKPPTGHRLSGKPGGALSNG
jgi:hypothetical protein